MRHIKLASSTRDLKPQNVMVVERPNRPDLVKAVIFGIARSLTLPSDYQSVRGMVVGTPRYMSPEQANGEQDIDARSDVFSLGIVADLELQMSFSLSRSRLGRRFSR